jgi:putative endonuclease
MWTVYLLRCSDGTIYCGATNNLERRLKAHARGQVKYTRGRLPVALAHSVAAADKSSALRGEAAWKRLTRDEKLRLITCAESTNSVSAEDANASFCVHSRSRSRVRRHLER